MKKLRRITVLLLSVCMLFGGVVTCYAADDYGLTANATKQKISAKYLHEKPVGILKLDMYYYEYNTYTKKTILDCLTNARTGGVTYISNSMNAKTGCEFEQLNAFVEADGTMVASKMYYVVQ